MSKLYRIKPLNGWKEKGEVGMDFEVQTLFGKFYVSANSEAGRNTPPKHWEAFSPGVPRQRIPGEFPTFAAAKAAAQEAYEARMAEGLEEAATGEPR